MRTNYDAFEFTNFMQMYMRGHPEVADSQEFGWEMYWTPEKNHPKSLSMADFLPLSGSDDKGRHTGH